MAKFFGNPKAAPVEGAIIDLGLVRARVGYSNGDFRKVTIEDRHGRPLARGDVPYRVLRELESES